MANQTITAPHGFRVAAVKAGIKKSGNLDLGLIIADQPCPAAATFTTNKVVGAPVVVSRQHIRSGYAQAVYVNAGNANVCTGERGLRDVQTICRHIAQPTKIALDDILVCSTGIIGHFLPMNKVRAGITDALTQLSSSARAGQDFARAIMTTDLQPKIACQTIKLAGKTVTIAGTAKGSGMIAPNMATMLAFITTDAAITPAMLRRALKDAVKCTFNKVTVDNHQSTSDTAIILASGQADNPKITKADKDYQQFAHALWAVCDDLAQKIAADGEGATVAVTIRVTGAASDKDATRALRAIADSPLVRTAFAGADPNWGRITSAVGYSGAKMDPQKTTCTIAGTTVFRNGKPARFNPAALSKKMKAKKYQVLVDLGLGKGQDFCYTCDLTRQYVTINADYHT
ncbi:MAG: bifunctional glutamate N-acetyltransferase/amino-acid acetyltransferase ArgJ [Sedimentisphaerales bacterium]|nr:bifunctional glutamate N-acetyltransferase/amino-acid acetyltransferase ArgJ [Sedimentisphaerales bacterium]